MKWREYIINEWSSIVGLLNSLNSLSISKLAVRLLVGSVPVPITMGGHHHLHYCLHLYCPCRQLASSFSSATHYILVQYNVNLLHVSTWLCCGAALPAVDVIFCATCVQYATARSMLVVYRSIAYKWLVVSLLEKIF